ncbi:MAG TPA: amidohydrolase family protein [Acidimicrobiales bacterium]|nr:amidohydrolase family protein [Acidimicrobiales bacterium]
MPSRKLDFPVFDVDNHMYEDRDALTKFLPPEYDGLIKYVEVNGRTKIAVRNQISEYIPNPTFDRVARPGAQEEYFRIGNPEGKSRREIMGQAMDCIPAFREPGARIELMDELGLDRAIMWPTLASLVEERLRDDPDAIHAVIHALNQWMLEQWTFNYDGRIFPTPVVTLPIVDKAVAELEFLLDNGAKIILIRPAPVPGFRGPRSFALPEFDPFWKLVEDSGIVVGMHASDSGYQRYANDWEGVRNEMTPFAGGGAFAAINGSHHRAIVDAMASVVGHGLATRFPKLKIAPVENGSSWVRPLLEDMESAYKMNPHLFEEHPVEVFKRNIFVHPFHEDDPQGLVRLVGVDNVLFGSDYPHPEGLADPLSFVDALPDLSKEEQAKVMGGNLARLMNVA